MMMLNGIKRKLAIIIPVIAVTVLTFTGLYLNQAVDMAFAGGGHN